MRAAIAIALKDLRLLARDKANLFFTFVFPVLIAIFFGVLFRNAGATTDSIVLTVVDECACDSSRDFVKALDDDAMIVATVLPTRTEAETAVRRGEALACIVLPESFAAGAESMFAGGGIEIEAIVDPSRKAEAALLVGKLNELAFRQLGQSLGDPEEMSRMTDNARASVEGASDLAPVDKGLLNDLFDSLDRLSSQRTRGDDDPLGEGGPFGGSGGWSPARVTVTEPPTRRGGPPSSYAVTFPQGIAWVLMSAIAAFAASIARERTRGTMLRLSVAPVSVGTILFGKALGCFIACVLGTILLLVIARVGFGVDLGDLPLLAVAVIVSGASGAGVMMLIGGVFRTEAAAEGAGRAVVLVLAMIGGGTIPLAFMPPFMQVVSSFSPFKWAIQATEGAVWRGFTAADMAQPLAILVAITVACGGIGFVMIRRTMSPH